MPTDTPDPADVRPDSPAVPSASDPVEQAETPDAKAAGAVGWQAVAPPGKPDGEVDTRA